MQLEVASDVDVEKGHVVFDVLVPHSAFASVGVLADLGLGLVCGKLSKRAVLGAGSAGWVMGAAGCWVRAVPGAGSAGRWVLDVGWMLGAGSWMFG